MRILFEPCGPMMLYSFGTLRISDLNPETSLKWSINRWEIFRIGLRCILAAIFSKR